MSVESEIRAMIDRETAAWDRQDAAALVALFHPDMVWPWPPDSHAHDPARWEFPQGRFDRQRWEAAWQELFRTHELVYNRRQTVRIVVSAEGDGAFAVVDVDTLWRRRADGAAQHWKGRACKGYTKVGERWWLIFHTGLLEYPPARNTMIFHVVTESDLRAHLAADLYTPSSLEECGFVHCALQSSVLAVANDYFCGVSGRVLVLEIDPERLTSEVKYEAAAPIPGGGSSHLDLTTGFPHVYGPIDVGAITGVGVLGAIADGYRWPPEFGRLEAFVAATP